jgi:hypothetical protein
MTEYHVLDLFAGLGGFSQAFAASERCGVTTVEIQAEFEPDIQADIFELRPSDFDREFDVVLASPPCKQFSPAQNLNGDHEPGADAVALVYHALGLIHGLDPAYWWLENPTGRLRSEIGAPTTTVTYCQYGEDRMKPTDLWGEHPTSFIGRRCQYGDDCHINTREGSNAARDECGKRTDAQRAKVPAELSTAIRDACERGLDGDAHEQTSLAEVAND